MRTRWLGGLPAAERGAGSVLVLAIVGAVVALTTALLPMLGVVVQSQVAENAADAAALAAADARIGAVAGNPCSLARLVARRNGARLVTCDGTDTEASVSVAVSVLGFEITARARAGPAPHQADTPVLPATHPDQSKTVSM